MLASSNDEPADGDDYVVGETGYAATDLNGLVRIRGKCGRSEIHALVTVPCDCTCWDLNWCVDTPVEVGVRSGEVSVTLASSSNSYDTVAHGFFDTAGEMSSNVRDEIANLPLWNDH